MRLILIRHCKTLFNISGHIMGWKDSPRAENWLEDVLFIQQELTSREQIPNMVYSSALGRARHTGEYLAEQFGVAAFHSESLNEINYGALAEKPKKWVALNYPLHKKDPEYVYPEGESFAAMQGRTVQFVNGLTQKYPQQTLLCVAHAGVIRALVSHFLHLEFAPQLRRRIGHRYIGVLSFDGSLCVGYEEWGEPSGFVSNAVIALPWTGSSGHCSANNRPA
jgi:broad specificity phosphatase PhoE